MRIWVTGLGVVSPLARGAGATMDRIVAGDRAIGPLTLFSLDGARSAIAGEVAGLSAFEVAPPGEEEGWSRTDAMAVIAAREALGAAGLDPASATIDLVLGGTTAGMFETEATLAALAVDPEAIAPLRKMLSHPLSSTADHVRAAVGPFRQVRSLCSACSGGANAILLGASRIRDGFADVVLAGGADGLCRLTYAGFGALSALSSEPCRPFDRRRTGLNLGEGAAFLLLERADRAAARGKKPIAELRGWAVAAEAHHITNPESSGSTAARVMKRALAVAGLGPADIDYVNAHGTATPLNDAMESAALRACFGAEIERIDVSSSKGQIGHTLAAAGAIEAAITVMAIDRGVLPPTVGLGEVDPACALRHVTEARPASIRAALSSSFGFGGTDTVLLFARPGAFPEPGASPRRPVVVTGAATVGPLGVLGRAGTHAYLDPGTPPDPGPIALTPGDHLDPARARRMDRAGKLTTIAIAAAGADGGLELDGDRSLGVGAVSGSAFGSVDGSTAFVRRVFEKGAKMASPADFPNLVPSSPVGHASIYLGLRGPVVAVSDLEVTAESALVTAIELLSAGAGEAIFAGSAEERSPMIERCLGPLCTGITDRGPRSEGASALLFETEEHARERGAKAVARVVGFTSWRGAGQGACSGLPSPAGRAAVFVGREDAHLREVLEGTGWAEAPMRSLAGRAGDQEGTGGFAAAAAVSALGSGEVDSALLIGVARDRGYAVVFERSEDASSQGRAP
ncbi:MAG: beta-ketoacyl-[acyl-carrier-protein] synthase family protein [Byssovorax sp.]